MEENTGERGRLKDSYALVLQISQQNNDLSRQLYDLAGKMDLLRETLQLRITSNETMMADLRRDFTDHEARIRQQEANHYVTPKAMWSGIGVIVTVLSCLFALVQLVNSLKGS